MQLFQSSELWKSLLFNDHQISKFIFNQLIPYLLPLTSYLLMLIPRSSFLAKHSHHSFQRFNKYVNFFGGIVNCKRSPYCSRDAE